MQHKVVCQGLWLFTWPRASSFICKHRHSQPLFSHMGQLQRGWWAVTAGAPGMFRLRQSWNTHDEWKRILYFFSPTLSSVLDLFISKHSPQIHLLLLSVVSSPLLCFPYPKLFEILGFFLKKRLGGIHMRWFGILWDVMPFYLQYTYPALDLRTLPSWTRRSRTKWGNHDGNPLNHLVTRPFCLPFDNKYRTKL